VASTAASGSIAAFPPATSVSFGLKGSKNGAGANAIDLPSWLNKASSVNGLETTDLQPWHIVVIYDQFDEDGDNVHSGVYEEYWAGPTKYKKIYKSDDFNQTEYGTEKGLYRSGDQQWPNRAQLQVRAEVVTPFSYGATLLQGSHAKNTERSFSGHKFQCVAIEGDSGVSDPTQYCFEPNSSALRYTRGWGWFQTVYNQIDLFQGRNVAREVDVTDGGKRYLNLRVGAIETISHVNDSDFAPPPGAVGPIGGRVSGVNVRPMDMRSFPQWPAKLRAQHFTVTVEIVIGKDGHVLSARGVSGPPEGYQASEDAVKKWVFQPYLVLGKPVEVEQKVEFSKN
jgi:hypothetical protein